MQKLTTLLFKAGRKILALFRALINRMLTWVLFYCNNIKFDKFRTNGIPFVSIARGGMCVIGNNLIINNGNLGNPIGRPQRCVFFVDSGASLVIGDNVGMSSTAIVAHQFISIGDNVKIGGGTCIYDTDFHSVEFELRNDINRDSENTKTKEVIIEENVFIGAHSTILKGVSIGKNSVIGACSVVTKSVPSNEIWAGNPARFIKKIILDD